MRVLMLPFRFEKNSSARLSRQQSHYLLHVLRKQPGDFLTVRDQQGTLYSVRLETADDSVCIIRDTGIAPDEHAAAATMADELPEIHLYQSVLKGKKMDMIIRQATEIGVQSIVPLMTQHTIPAFSAKDAEKKQSRWSTICREALQQSGSPILTRVHAPLDVRNFSKFHADAVGGPVIFFHHEEIGAEPLPRILQRTCALDSAESAKPKISIVVGPEGGLSDSDIACITAAERETAQTRENREKDQNSCRIQVHPAFLKTNILRAETAAVYALGAVQTLLTMHYVNDDL